MTLPPTLRSPALTTKRGTVIIPMSPGRMWMAVHGRNRRTIYLQRFTVRNGMAP